MIDPELEKELLSLLEYTRWQESQLRETVPNIAVVHKNHAKALAAVIAALAHAPATPTTLPEVQPARDALELLRDMILATHHGQQHREAMHGAIMTIAPFLH